VQDAQFTLVESVADVQNFFSWLGQRRTWLAADTETGGFDWWRDDLRLVQIGDANHGWAFDWGDWAGVVKEAFRVYSGPIAFHNLKFDLHFLEHNGVVMPRHQLHDTFSMAHVVEPNLRSGLKPASERLIHPDAGAGQQALKFVMNKGKWTWATIPTNVPEYWMYGALDPVLTARLAETLYPRVVERGLQRVYETEVAVAIVLKDMERRGVKIDTDFCWDQAARILDYERTMEQFFLDQYGLKNPGSTKQIADLLMAQGVRMTERTPTGKIKVTQDVLESIDHPLAEHIVEYRKWSKIRSTYFEDFIEFENEGLLHASINPLGAVTGRMSCMRPNLQNVPRSWVRNAFVARPGHTLMLADYDQIELRIMAHYAGVQEMIDAVHAGEDLHTMVGKLVYNVPTITKAQRQVVKSANFAKIYGAGAAKFAGTAGISVDEARRFMAMYDSRFPAIKQFVNDLVHVARTQGWVQTPYLGRLQVVDGPDYAYKIVNYYIQGTAADVIKKKLVEMANTPTGQFMELTIHDEIALDVPNEYIEDAEQEIRTTMPENDAFSVPISVGIDKVHRWGEKYADTGS